MAFLEGAISTVAFIAAVVLIWGIVPVIRAERRSASRNLMVGVMITLLGSLAHVIWFGFGQLALERLYPGLWERLTYFGGTATPQVFFGMTFLLAMFFFYRFTWFLIPEKDRSGYNLFTAPLWPRRVGWIWGRRDRRQSDT